MTPSPSPDVFTRVAKGSPDSSDLHVPCSLKPVKKISRKVRRK